MADPPPRRRPDQPITRPAIPAVRPRVEAEADFESVAPPIDTPRESERHDSTRPLKWELQKSLDVLKQTAERNEALLAKNETLVEAIDELQDNLTKERKARLDVEDELEKLKKFRRDSIEEDERRDKRIKKIEDFAEVLAPHVGKILSPQMQAEGAVGAKAVTDESSKATKRWAAVASFVGVTIATAISTGFAQCGKAADPGITVPDTKPKPAGSGFAGIPE